MIYVLTGCEQDQDGTPDDGQGNCPKHVEFYSKNKFEKLVHPNSQIYFWNKTLHVSDSSSVHHQEFRPDPARNLSASSCGRL